MNLGLLEKYDTTARQYDLVPVQNERRFSHTWTIGKSGVGKSTALLRWILEDIEKGDGVALFDPHGETADLLLSYIPKHRLDDVIYFNPASFPVPFNIFQTVPRERQSFVASAIVDTFKSAWGYNGFATPTLDMFLYNGARALIDMQDGTLFGLKYLLTSSHYRKRVISNIQDPVIRDFWKVDFETHMPEREQREKTMSTLNKIGALISDPAIRNCIAQPSSKIDFNNILNSRKIFVAALPQGKLGVEKSTLIGSLLLSQLQLAALGRSPRSAKRHFHIFVDECHRFAPSILCEMLSGIRKFGVSLTLANQYLDQLPVGLKSALIGTTGTMIAFQLGALDAETLEPEFKLYPDDYSLCELEAYMAYTRSGLSTHLLRMPTINLRAKPAQISKIKNHSRTRFSSNDKKLAQKLRRFLANT